MQADLPSGLACVGMCAAAACAVHDVSFCLGELINECVSERVCLEGVKPAGSMKGNLTTLFMQHIPLLFASQESDAWRGGSGGEGEGC